MGKKMPRWRLTAKPADQRGQPWVLSGYCDPDMLPSQVRRSVESISTAALRERFGGQLFQLDLVYSAHGRARAYAERVALFEELGEIAGALGNDVAAAFESRNTEASMPSVLEAAQDAVADIDGLSDYADIAKLLAASDGNGNGDLAGMLSGLGLDIKVPDGVTAKQALEGLGSRGISLDQLGNMSTEQLEDLAASLFGGDDE